LTKSWTNFTERGANITGNRQFRLGRIPHHRRRLPLLKLRHNRMPFLLCVVACHPLLLSRAVSKVVPLLDFSKVVRVAAIGAPDEPSSVSFVSGAGQFYFDSLANCFYRLFFYLMSFQNGIEHCTRLSFPVKLTRAPQAWMERLQLGHGALVEPRMFFC